ncbi:MAG TPA: glycine cleavage T C-terminal barrel domain-containing protein [Pyrinomonadaceae bacterium]|jgi:folate-binding protein YgfZ|nr:glycine cleavage T C-terminal barrel domain-containing protein [Pyrinomonadaceae bacterium]
MNEYEIVRDGGAGLIDLSELRGRIRISGSEATMFLNGLMTNDMKSLAANRWMASVFPTVQGRLIGAVRVIRGGDPSFLIDTETPSHDAVLKTISRFTMAGDFKVSDVTAETALLTVQGQLAGEVIEKVFETPASEIPVNGVSEIHGVMIIRASHTGENGFDILLDSSRKAEMLQVLETAGAQPISADTLEILRVEAGIARFGQDVDETTVVPETNLDDAVSYTKGCYVGQEIIVRIKHRGHPAKKLTGLRFETDAQIESGAIINSTENQEIGRVTSAVVSPRMGSIGIGYVRYEHLAEGTRVVTADGINATVTGLPFVETNG